MGTRREEGGSSAIKGFLFQFDKTILEILDSPKKSIRFEQKEDIERGKYYIQVKNRESAKYYPSSVRQAVKQLIELFIDGVNGDFCLYCHFKDKQPHIWTPTTNEIKVILGQDVRTYKETQIEAFALHFLIQFSDDYKTEFDRVIDELKKTFGLGTRDVAIMYHAVIRSYLLDLAVKGMSKRKTSYAELKKLVANVQSHVSMEGYQVILGAEKYERLIRKQYFLQKRVNIDNFERLFIIECDEALNPVDIMQMVSLISRKYFIKDKSPQPYILFRKLDAEIMKDIKQGLVDKDFFFNDGTWFDGDKIRTDKLFSKSTDERFGKIKFLPNEKLLENRRFLDHWDEIYEFYVDESLSIRGFENRYIQIPVAGCQQALKIVNK